MLTFNAFRAAVDQIPSAGQIREPYGLLLFALVRYQRPRVIVEVGTWHGYSTAWMARALLENGEGGYLVAIDNWTLGLHGASQDGTRRTLVELGVADAVHFRAGDSLAVAWPPAVDFAFVDGNHSLDYCAREVSRAAALGASTIVVHDTTSWWGPRDWLSASRAQTSTDAAYDLLELPDAEGLTICVRRAQKPPVQFPRARYPMGYIEDLGCAARTGAAVGASTHGKGA